jgi:hypothetical protein
LKRRDNAACQCTTRATAHEVCTPPATLSAIARLQHAVQRADIASRAPRPTSSAGRDSIHDERAVLRGTNPYPFRGSSKTGLVACGERGLPGIGKPPAFCAMQDRKSAESFCRSIALCCPCSPQALGGHPSPPVERMRSTQGRIYAVPRIGYGLVLRQILISNMNGVCRDAR